MLYINTFLDKLGELVRGEADIESVYDLTDERKIVEMFIADCKTLVNMYRNGDVEYGEAKKALDLLKKYVVSQLGLHFEKVKEFAESKGVKIDAKLSPEIINEIALYINRVEKEL